jgi:hypothetical protein
MNTMKEQVHKQVGDPIGKIWSRVGQQACGQLGAEVYNIVYYQVYDKVHIPVGEQAY